MTKSLIGHCKELRLHSKQQNFKQVRNDIFQVGSFAQPFKAHRQVYCHVVPFPKLDFRGDIEGGRCLCTYIPSFVVLERNEVRSTRAVFCGLLVFPLYSIHLLYSVLRDCHVTQMTTKFGNTYLLTVEPYQSCILRVPKQI